MAAESQPPISETMPNKQRPAAVRALLRSKVATTGLIVLSLLVLLALFAPALAPHPPAQVAPQIRLQAPSAEHLFGTDHLGRDVFSRVLHGTRVSLLVGAAVVVFSTIVGGLLGLLAGYFPALDNVVMRLMDGLMAFPGILLAIALMASLGPRPSNVVIALGIVYAPRTARIVRATALTLREQPFVEGAMASGSKHLRIIFRHIAPNCLGPLNVQVTFIFAYAVLAEAALSFLGVGSPPNLPTWGNILSEGRPFLPLAPWITLFPGIAIMICVLALNLAGDGLRDILDPRLRGVV